MRKAFYIKQTPAGRAFGFENRGDHVFQLLPDDFSSVTEENLKEYCRLCGVLHKECRGDFCGDPQEYMEITEAERAAAMQWADDHKR